jgi:hypothetical protein
MAYGNRHFAPESEHVMMVDAVSGAPADTVLVDRHTGRLLVEPDFKVVPGPASARRKATPHRPSPDPVPRRSIIEGLDHG